MEELAQILNKSSRLYRYDVEPPSGGTTATAISEPSEELAYWAFDMLVSIVSPSSSETAASGAASSRYPTNARLVLPALLERFDTTLRRFVLDQKLRGRMPLERYVISISWSGILR